MSTEHLLGDVGQILDALMSPANDTRGEAERHLRNLTVSLPAETLLLLAQIGAQGVGGFQTDPRALALILLRRLAFTALPGLFLNERQQHASCPFDVLGERTRHRIETVLCAGLKDEMNTEMRKRLGKCTADWAGESFLRQRPCLELPPVLLELITSQHPFHRFTPFQLLNLAPTLLVDSVTDPVPPQQLAGLILAGINDPSLDVRVEALKAMRGVIMEGLTGREREEIGPGLVLEAFKILPHLPHSLLPHALEPMVELVSTHPSLFVPSLPSTLSYLLSLLSPPGLMPDYSFSPYPPSAKTYEEFEEIANPATEILLTLGELRRSHFIGWDGGRAGRELVGLLIGRLVVQLEDQGEECTDWLEETNLDEEIDAYPAYPEESLDRLAIAIGGGTILPALSQHVQSLLQHQNWRYRYSALLAIAAVVEGTLEELQPRLQDVLTLISATSKDSHPRVRYAFLQCIGQLCQDCEGAIQSDYGEEVLDALFQLLADPVTRVRCHAGASMCNFFGDGEIPNLKGHLEPAVRALLKAFHGGPLYVQEQMLATLSAVASRAEDSFIPYYREVMDVLLSILNGSKDESERKLVGRAMEGATLIGLAVGKATFSVDAVKLAQILITIQNQVTKTDDPRTAYLVEAWSCLCRTLQADFRPFLPYVIPPLLKAASYKPSQSPEDKLSLTNEEAETYDQISMTRNAELDEKILAFDNLMVYAHTMRAAFEPWLSDSMGLSLDALTFPYSEEVRESAAFLVPALLQVAKDSAAWSDASGPLQQVFQTLINAMVKEEDSGFLAFLYKSFTDSLHVIALPLPPSLTSHFLRTASNHLEDLYGRRQDRKAQEPYMDEGDLELYLEEQGEEDAALNHMTKAMDMVLQFGGEGDAQVRSSIVSGRKRISEVKRLGLSERSR